MLKIYLLLNLNYRTGFIVLILYLFYNIQSFAQCSKPQFICETGDASWRINSQSKSAKLFAGETYEMKFLVYSSTDYRISIGSEYDELENLIEFELYEMVSYPEYITENKVVVAEEKVYNKNGKIQTDDEGNPILTIRSQSKEVQRKIFVKKPNYLIRNIEHNYISTFEFSSIKSRTLILKIKIPKQALALINGVDTPTDENTIRSQLYTDFQQAICTAFLIEHKKSIKIGF